MRRILPTLGAAAALAVAVSAPALAAPPGADDPSRAAAEQVLVGWKDGTTSADRDRVAAKVKARGREKLAADADVLKLPRGASNARAIDKLSADAAVRYAEPDWVVTHHVLPTESDFTGGKLWGMEGDALSPSNQYGSQADEAWNAGHVGSPDVYVGIIDEGFQFDHPDLAANTWTNFQDPVNGIDDDGDGYVDDVHGWDFANNDASTYDGGTRGSADGHGTHVAGTIGGVANNGGIVGVNWNVKLISAKFLGKRGGSISNAIKAVDYLTDLKRRKGLNIVASNNSWGGGGFSQALSDAISRANDAGILFVVAAGNGNKQGVGIDSDSSPQYPASYTQPNVVSVAAIDSAGAIAPWSNYGAKSVDLGAPGVAIWSSTPYNSYASYSGTSMATPHVTGAAALYASTHPGATAAAIKQAILSSTIATSSLAGKTVTGGRLNAGGF
jgi:subtilisin family serine protease